MNRKWIMPAVSLFGVSLLLAGCGRETQRKLEATQQELTTATNDLVAAHAETAQVKTQMQEKIGELEQNISKLTEEKAQTEAQVSSLKSELENTQRESQEKIAQQEIKIGGLEQDKQALAKQLAEVRQDLADLEKSHATTVAHLQAMREEYVKLTDEKATLEAKLNNLTALKEQIRVVKQDMHAKKVEERKRIDRAESALGNHGYLLKNGSWVASHEPGKYPLNQEIRLAE